MRTGPAAEGTVTAYLPEIGGLLPVYVEDRYSGFEVKAFPRLTSDELGRYLELNVAAVRDVVVRVGGVDAALANHLVMGPAILARAGVRFVAKIHGSALSYTVRPHRERFLPLAREGLDAAGAILVGSGHTAERLWETMADQSLPARTRLGPPGVDIEAFVPLARSAAAPRLLELAEEVRVAGGATFGRVAEDGASAVQWLADARGPRVTFVGKLIVSKGPDLLAAAWPLVHRANPGARLLIAGFGAYREPLERLLGALADGDISLAREIAGRGRELEGGPAGPLRLLDGFLAGVDPEYVNAARSAAGSIALSGRLEHAEVARLLPATDALVVPSTFPEAFGMVAAEAAAAGVLPISAGHSGLAEVSSVLAAEVPPAVRHLLSFDLDTSPVEAIAEALNGWLALPETQRREIGSELSRIVGERWSWGQVARGVLAAAAGRLDELPPARAVANDADLGASK